MPQEQTVVHDPKLLRAIAHPVRNRILGELHAQGPMRAADVARELDVPANQASFHLRQLAKYGLVEEDPDAARDKRDRVWRVIGGGLVVNLEEVQAVPGGAAAAEFFAAHAASWGRYVVDRAHATAHEEGIHRSVTDVALRLTAEESRQLNAEVQEVVDRWADRTRGDRETERRTYLYYGILQPHPGPPEAPIGGPTG